MSRTDDFDPSAYMTCPRLDVPSLIALCRQLLAKAPPELPKPVETAKRRLAENTRSLEQGFKVMQFASANPDKRPIDVATDNSWACIKARLEPYSWLDANRFADATRATEIIGLLLPTGLSFTQLEYGAQWAEASWRIQTIADEKLEPDLRRLCGDLFVDELYHWHDEYAKMVGVVAKRHAGKSMRDERPSLTELRRQAIQSVVAWQVQMVALYLTGVTEAREALRPTDVYRDKLAASAHTPAEPPSPLPPGDTTPTVAASAV